MKIQNSNASGIYHELSGPTNAPVLVFSHALGGNLSMWDAPAAVLAENYRVLRYDTRGHGRSTQLEGRQVSLADLSQDALSLLDQYSIERAHFCGLSLGGMTGQWLGLHAAERLRSLVLVGTAPRIGDDETWNQRISTVQEKGTAALASGTMERWFTAGFRQQFPERVAHFEAILRATTSAGYIACARVVQKGVLARDEYSQLRTITTPTLVMTGSQDVAASPTEAQDMASHIPGSRYVELAAAHISPVEASSDFIQALRSFLP